MVAGGGSVLTGLEKDLSDGLGVEASRFDPLKEISVSDECSSNLLPVDKVFLAEAIGVELAVTPIVEEDDYSITLELNPRVTEFEGFVEYGGPTHRQGSIRILPADIRCSRSLYQGNHMGRSDCGNGRIDSRRRGQRQ